MNQRYPVKASLFVTCIIDQLYPNVGESVVRVLRRFGVDLDFQKKQTCCGQPAFNTGFWTEAKPFAKRFLNTFTGDRFIVVPSGSCASMIRNFYPELLQDEPDAVKKYRKISSKVYEVSEFIVDVLGITNLEKYLDPESPKRKVTYHEACHLRRELGVLTQPRTLIESMPNIQLLEMNQAEVCCGFGGTFSIKYPDISGAMLDDKISNIAQTRADTLVACDNSCLMHIAGGMDKNHLDINSMNLIQLIDEAMTSKQGHDETNH